MRIKVKKVFFQWGKHERTHARYRPNKSFTIYKYQQEIVNVRYERWHAQNLTRWQSAVRARVFLVKCCLQKACQNGRISKITVYTDLDTWYKQTKKA